MNKYETIFVANSSLGEETVKALVEKFTSLIGSNAEVEKVESIRRRIGDVDEMIRYFAVFGNIFSRTDVHTFVDLAGIHADDFAVERTGKIDCQCGFAGGGGTGYDNCFY